MKKALISRFKAYWASCVRRDRHPCRRLCLIWVQQQRIIAVELRIICRFLKWLWVTQDSACWSLYNGLHFVDRGNSQQLKNDVAASLVLLYLRCVSGISLFRFLLSAGVLGQSYVYQVCRLSCKYNKGINCNVIIWKTIIKATTIFAIARADCFVWAKSFWSSYILDDVLVQNTCQISRYLIYHREPRSLKLPE